MRLAANLLVVLLFLSGLPFLSGCGGGGEEVAQSDNSGAADEYGEDYGGGEDAESEEPTSGSAASSDSSTSEEEEEEYDEYMEEEGDDGEGREKQPRRSPKAKSDEHAEDDEHAEQPRRPARAKTDEHAQDDEHAEEEDAYADEEEGYMEDEEDEYEDEQYEYEDDEGAYSDEEEEYDEYMEEEEYEEDYGEEYGDEEGYGRPREEPPEPKTLLDHAHLAFGQGDNQQAFQYLLAHALTVDKPAATEMLNKMGWVSVQSEDGEGTYAFPTLAVRWAVGVDASPADFAGNPYPVGENQSRLTSSARSGYGRDAAYGEEEYSDEEGEGYGDSRPRARGGSADIPPSLDRLTGELGERVLTQLRDRITKGAFGLVLSEAMTAGSSAAGDRNRSRGYGSDYGDEYEEDYGYEEEYEEDYGGGYGAGGNRRPPAPAAEVAQTGIAPGVTLVGVADERELRTRAKDIGAHVLILFEVELKPNPRTGLVSNETQIHVYDMFLDDDVYRTKTINNMQVQNARAGVKGFENKDNVESEITGLFEFLDDRWWLHRFPEIQADHVVARIKSLAKTSSSDPLPVLTEIRMWNTRGLIQDAHLASAYNSVLGDAQTGELLAAGTEEQRQQLVQRWLPAGAVTPVSEEGKPAVEQPEEAPGPYR